MESKINQVIIDAVHDVCEECIARKNCNQRCYEVVKMVSLTADIERIARQEERERCIKEAQDIYCESICIVRDICKDHGQCSSKNKFRKAMEGGEE